MLPAHSPDCASGWFALEMSLDTNELQSSKKKKKPKNLNNPVYSMGGGSARAGFAPHLGQLTLLLPVVGQAQGRSDTPDLPQQNALFLMDLWPFPGVLQETRGGCEGRARLHPPGGTSTKPPNKGLLESPLCTEHADYQAQFQQTQQKKELHAQMTQRLTSKIHPGQSFPGERLS